MIQVSVSGVERTKSDGRGSDDTLVFVFDGSCAEAETFLLSQGLDQYRRSVDPEYAVDSAVRALLPRDPGKGNPRGFVA